MHSVQAVEYQVRLVYSIDSVGHRRVACSPSPLACQSEVDPFWEACVALAGLAPVGTAKLPQAGVPYGVQSSVAGLNAAPAGSSTHRTAEESLSARSCSASCTQCVPTEVTCGHCPAANVSVAAAPAASSCVRPRSWVRAWGVVRYPRMTPRRCLVRMTERLLSSGLARCAFTSLLACSSTSRG